MRFAVLTDIHANREAFEAVLADVAAHGVDRIALLGDIVGYGADPVWCCDKAAELVAAGAICVRGNHDNAAAGAAEAMSPLARRALEWTRGRLGATEVEFLAQLPLTAEAEGALFVHASANRPEEWSYVTSDTKATPSFRASTARLILCGHVHVPLLASCDMGGMVREQAFRPGLPIPLLSSRRWLAVVGSVGQPRDGVAQAGWALLDTGRGELTFRRTAYDAAGAAQKVRAAGLPEELAVRLLVGR
ncbi:metallophosphoesterase family protein [Tabrizicola sp.]|uniref:metallophosphoesterase family protein n=1 Tax=Tabrizicola sp. TaxID=2005166 RepID=UPI001A5DB31D|nr:metallophosphoesterase family protein [Tabrizicola sp.]MBL9074978.1 metallophosphoesterase [Tabrizicola sp.]